MDLQGVDSTITILLNRPLRPALGASTRSNKYVAHLGTSILPKPMAAAAARTNRSFLVNFIYDRTFIPAAMTLPNRKVVTPPSTGFGIERKTPDSLPSTPYRIKNPAQKKPAFRFAHRVNAITPLFWAKMLPLSARVRLWKPRFSSLSYRYREDLPHWGDSEQGREEAGHSVREYTSLDSTLEFWLQHCQPSPALSHDIKVLTPSTATRERSAEAVISPIASIARTTYTAKDGKMAGPYTEIGNRLTQRKVMAGARSILDESTYPVAPATIMPTIRPMMILAFLMNGDPNISTKTIVMKLRKPRPMYSAEPHLSDVSRDYKCHREQGSLTARH